MHSSIKSLRKDALSLFQTGIDAADPYVATKLCLAVAENHFEISLDLDKPAKKRCGRWSKIHLLAFGKAACKMLKAAAEIIPEHRLASQPLAITNPENVIALKNTTVISANHPDPDLSGHNAAKLIAEKLANTEANDLVLLLVSGGGSALIPYPATGITLADKQTTTRLLLASGATIHQINCVRKHLSRLKGGHLAKLAAPAYCHALILSDVVDDDPSTIASGPTIADNTTFADAVHILKEKQIWQQTPLNVQVFLQKGVHGEVEETPKSNELFFNKTAHTIIGSNRISLKAITQAAQNRRYKIAIFNDQLSGEAKDIAEQLVLYAIQLTEHAFPQATAILAGGESTVRLQGTGRGGRNQELALAFAIAAQKHQLPGKWAFLSGGTDGLDGPTDAAGGLVDTDTLARLKKARTNPENRLNNNDSYSALKKSDDLVITGATGTNVADFQILLIHP
ncbi:MAG: glycerate kinase [Methylococcales bacterium]|jgi:hydroxypyruvate reductase|nr:glycerate kinase [Methylococcaceae bacterium]